MILMQLQYYSSQRYADASVDPRPCPSRVDVRDRLTISQRLLEILEVTMMYRTWLLTLIALTALAFPALAQKSTSQQPTQTERKEQLESSAAEALVELAAWKPQAARRRLESDAEKGADVALFKTAWALLKAEEGKLEEASSLLEAASAKDKKDPAPAFYLGEVLYWRKQSKPAESAWKDAHQRATAWIKKNPDDARGQYYLGAALIRVRQFAEARGPLQKALEGGFNPAMCKYQIGLSYAFSGNWQAAKDTLGEVVKLDPSFAHAYYYRGLAWDKLKRKDNMLVDMDQFVKLAGEAPEASKARSLLAAARR
jgi:tetratricopeptide (TPR) repeat protein